MVYTSAIKSRNWPFAFDFFVNMGEEVGVGRTGASSLRLEAFCIGEQAKRRRASLPSL